MSMEHFKIDQEKDIKEMEEKHIMAEFTRKKRIQYVGMGIVLVAIVAVMAGFANKAAGSSWLGYIPLGIAIIFVVFSYFNWRCPACKKYLGRGYSLKTCRSCGAKLHE